MSTRLPLVTQKYENISDDTLDAWVEQFHRHGFIFLEEFLRPDFIAQLKSDLADALAKRDDDGNAFQVQGQMFEQSPANLDLFDMEPMISFAERLVAHDCHVFHNNSFTIRPGGGISRWHQDDDLHYAVTDGEAPTNVRLPVLFFTANYYLTDVETVAKGPTQLIPGSHLFGKRPPGSMGAVHGTVDAMEGTEYEDQIFSALGKAGSVICFNNQVWHRGGPNQSDSTRYITQVSYGRRIIGPMHPPFMNYQMPEHVYKDADPRRKRLLGFKQSGAYG